MTYFIVETPYEKCFDIFFKTELGYPNFYRMTELLSVEEQYHNLTLIAPYPTKEPSTLENIHERANALGVKYLPFGEELDTAFAFDHTGTLQINPLFK